MTIAAAMYCADGIALCADSLEAVGAVHRQTKKLIELDVVSNGVTAVLVNATDDGTFSDALIEKISDAINGSDGTFASTKDLIEDAVLNYCESIWRVLDSSQPKPSSQILLGLKTTDALRLLHINTPIVRKIDAVEFIGFGTELAVYKSNQYKMKDIPVDVAAPLLAYIVGVVKENSQYCGRSTDLAIIHPNGIVEHKTEEYISKTTQGYKSLNWLLDTWVFPFLPLFVHDGQDALSMIGALGEPKAEWTQKIPDILKFLTARKNSILAGEIPAIPSTQKRNQALNQIHIGATVLQNAYKTIYEEGLVSYASFDAVKSRLELIHSLGKILGDAANKEEIDVETIQQSVERISLLLTSSPTREMLVLEMSADQPSPCAEESPERESSSCAG